jgi:thiol:disulfide interchange protein
MLMKRCLPLAALVLTLAAPWASAQYEARSKLYVRVDGEVARVAIETRINPGWHLYHGPTTADLGDGGGIGTETVVTLSGGDLEWSAVRYPAPHKLKQPLPGQPNLWIYGHEGTIVFYALGRSGTGAEIDPDSIDVEITGLTCEDNGTCIMGSEELTSEGEGPDRLFKEFPADLVIGETGGGPQAGNVDPPVGTQGSSTGRVSDVDWESVTYADYEPRGEKLERSLLLWLVFAFIAGVLLNVMPCVLPVVSIKVLSFVQQAGEDKRRILALGTAFAAGIFVVFLGLAAMAAFAQQGWGDQFQSETFKIVMIAVVFGFSLSLFDVFELGVPSKVGQLAGGMRREGLGDAFFKGMMATVLATPCSGPFLGSTLTWALSQPEPIIFAVFSAVGLGMAAPYVLLTSNPALLKYVPKPGQWMQTFKHLMGFLLLATVIFLMVSVRQDLLLFAVTFLIFVGLACWQWGRYAKLGQPPARRLATGVLTIAIILVGARFSFVDFRGMFFEPEVVAAAEGECHVVWEDFDPEQLAQYHAQGVSVMVDFTADWCFNCKLNEKFVYESRDVCEKLHAKGVVTMKADLTHSDPKTDSIERLRKELGANSIPFMAIFPGDDWEHPYTFLDIVTQKQLLAALENLPDPGTLVGAR